MVDRGRFPIRPKPLPSTPRYKVSDPAEAAHELDGETSSLASRELAELLGEDEKFRSPTVEITADELEALLEQARPARAPELPASRPMLTTQPYDEVTAYVLLDKDDPPPAPSTNAVEAPEEDAPEIETFTSEDHDDDEAEPVEAEVEADASGDAPGVSTQPVAFIPSAPSSASASQSIPPAGPVSAAPPAGTPSSIPIPIPIPIPLSPARLSVPSTSTEWPGENDRKRKTRMVIGAALAVAAMVILILVFTESEPAPTPPVPAVVTETPPPVAPAPSTPKPQTLAEIEARKALSRLRDGMGDCVRHAIGSLPGSSPAIPPAMKQTSGVGYTAVPADWRTAVWSCAKFRYDAPMQFQLQWQSVKPGAEALGLAWVDDDGDGEPDRAFGFRAIAKGAHDVELGDVGPVEMRPVLPVR